MQKNIQIFSRRKTGTDVAARRKTRVLKTRQSSCCCCCCCMPGCSPPVATTRCRQQGETEGRRGGRRSLGGDKCEQETVSGMTHQLRRRTAAPPAETNQVSISGRNQGEEEVRSCCFLTGLNLDWLHFVMFSLRPPQMSQSSRFSIDPLICGFCTSINLK